MKRKCIYMLGMLLAISLIFAGSVLAAEDKSSGAGLETTAEAAVLMEAASGEILWSKEPDKELPMASVTKIMTLLLAYDALEQGKIKYDDRITASENACDMGGSQIYLEPGEEMSLKEVLISVAVGSANDASVAVAEHIAGSVESFVEMMNQKAKDLGCKHTRFVNPNGLPAENHYTSALDMAIILKEAMKYPDFVKTSSIYRYDLRGGDFVLWNTNKLLKWYRGTDAGKTGWTNEAKYCLASSVQRDGMRLITVVLGTPETRSHFRESIKIYNYGFARYEAASFAKKGDKLKTLKVGKGVEDHVTVVASEDIAMAVPKGQKDQYKGKLVLPQEVTAPVEKGQKLGEFKVMQGEREIRKVAVVARSKVEKATVFGQIYKIMYKAFVVD